MSDAPDDPDADDPGAGDPGAGDRPPGYAWDFAVQERDLKAEYPLHRAILDEMEEEELRALDLSDASDYLVWAAAQAFDELGLQDQAASLLRRLTLSRAPHPALSYPEIALRLQEILKDRGEYEESIALLERVEREDPGLAAACLERRAEVLVLSGRVEEGLRLFEEAAAKEPGPWTSLCAAWALLQRGEYERSARWAGRADKAARRLEDRQEAREAQSEIERVRREGRDRARRRHRPPPEGGPAGSLEERRQEILAALDALELRLVDRPPRSAEERRRAEESLRALQGLASHGWDEAVERQDEAMIAAFDDLQWEVVDLAERFGIDLPELDGD